MDLLDFVIVALLALAAWTGFRRGAVLQLFTYLGLLIGLVVGAVLAPKLAGLATDRFWQSVIALGTFFAVAGLGDALGWIVGAKFWRITRASRLGYVDAAGGSVLGVIAVLLAAWFVAYNLAGGPFPTVSRQIRGSAIVRGVNDILPNPPYVLGQIKKFLNRFGFPEVFAGLPRWQAVFEARAEEWLVAARMAADVELRQLVAGVPTFVNQVPFDLAGERDALRREAGGATRLGTRAALELMARNSRIIGVVMPGGAVWIAAIRESGARRTASSYRGTAFAISVESLHASPSWM